MKLPKHLKLPPGYARTEDFRTTPDDDDTTRLAKLEATAWFLRENTRALEKIGVNTLEKLRATEAMIVKFRAGMVRLENAEEAALQEAADNAEKARKFAYSSVDLADSLERLGDDDWAAMPADVCAGLRALLPELIEKRPAALALLTAEERAALGH